MGEKSAMKKIKQNQGIDHNLGEEYSRQREERVQRPRVGKRECARGT